MNSLGNKVLVAAVWSVGLRMFIKSLALINTIILARLLVPEDFGVVAIVMSVFAFIDILQSFGFDTVLIQKQKASPSVYNTAWTVQALFGALTGSIMFLISPLIAQFYNDPRLIDAGRITALFFLIQGFTNIGVVNFRKDLDFKKEFTYRSLVKVFSVAITIGLAIYFRSYWALLISMLFTRLFEVWFSYYMSKYRPQFTLAAWREIIGFSSWLFLNSLMIFFSRNSTNLVVGKLLGVGGSGIYAFANEFSTLPNSELVAAVNRATFPGYSKVSDDKNKLRELYLRTLAAIVSIGIPASAAVAMLAHLFVPVLLGDKWLETIPVIQVLGIAFAVVSVNTNAGYIFQAVGKPHIPAIANIARAIFIVILLFLLVPRFGLVGAAWSMLGLALIMFPVYFTLLRRQFTLGLREYLATMFRPIVGTLSMYGVIHQVVPYIETMRAAAFTVNVWLFLGVSIFAGLSYLLTVLFLWLLAGRPEGPESYVVNIIAKKLGRSKTSGKANTEIE